MKNNEGFTLVEILAVIVILGVLMIIAIPSVTEYISGSRDNSFLTTVEKYIDAAIVEITNFEFSVNNEGTTYYIPTKCLEMETDNNKSPYGEWKESYVVVTHTPEKNQYYYTGRDSSNHGILLTHRDLLSTDEIKTDIKSINTGIGVGNRTKIVIYSDKCDGTRSESVATKKISENGKLE